jgi:hypothetical protein
MSEEERSMSGAKQSKGRGPHVYAGRALPEELRTERERHFDVWMLCADGSPH